MCELHAAVALAQLAKLDAIVARRRRYGEGLGARLQGIPGVLPQGFVAGARPSYWFYLLRIDEWILGARAEFVRALRAEGLNLDEGCHQGPAVYLYDVFTQRRGFGGTEGTVLAGPARPIRAGALPDGRGGDRRLRLRSGERVLHRSTGSRLEALSEVEGPRRT